MSLKRSADTFLPWLLQSLRQLSHPFSGPTILWSLYVVVATVYLLRALGHRPRGGAPPARHKGPRRGDPADPGGWREEWAGAEEGGKRGGGERRGPDPGGGRWPRRQPPRHQEEEVEPGAASPGPVFHPWTDGAACGPRCLPSSQLSAPACLPGMGVPGWGAGRPPHPCRHAACLPRGELAALFPCQCLHAQHGHCSQTAERGSSLAAAPLSPPQSGPCSGAMPGCSRVLSAGGMMLSTGRSSFGQQQRGSTSPPGYHARPLDPLWGKFGVLLPHPTPSSGRALAVTCFPSAHP